MPFFPIFIDFLQFPVKTRKSFDFYFIENYNFNRPAYREKLLLIRTFTQKVSKTGLF